MVDIGGGMEVAGEGRGEFLTELPGFEILLLDAGVVVAEGRVQGGTQHAAAASIGIREETEFSGIGGAFGGHGFSRRAAGGERRANFRKSRRGPAVGRSIPWAGFWKSCAGPVDRMACGSAGRPAASASHGAKVATVNGARIAQCLLSVNRKCCCRVSSFEWAVENGEMESSRKTLGMPNRFGGLRGGKGFLQRVLVGKGVDFRGWPRLPAD